MLEMEFYNHGPSDSCLKFIGIYGIMSGWALISSTPEFTIPKSFAKTEKLVSNTIAIKSNKLKGSVEYFWRGGSPNFPEAWTHRLIIFDPPQCRNQSV